MYYSKDLGRPAYAEGVNLAQIRKIINFLPFVHASNHATLASLLSNETTRRALLDSWAALIAQLRYSDLLDASTFIDSVCAFFHTYIQGKGYKLIAEVSELYSAREELYFLVTGCQTSKLCSNRVLSAYKAVRHLGQGHNSVTVVFSGANPSNAKASVATHVAPPTTLNEAAEMQAYFRELRDADKKFPKNLTCNLKEESESTRTSENISLFFNHLDLSAKRENHVVVASSLFHLPRLITEIESYLAQHQDTPVQRITLVGSEDFRGRDEAKDHNVYVKASIFEAFSLIFSSPDIGELFMVRH